MTEKQLCAIGTAVQNQINAFRHCANVRDCLGDEEEWAFFLEQANELRDALDALLDENPTR